MEGDLLVAFAGGGTGGHLFPGLSVADELKQLGAECVFMGAGTALELKETGSRGLEFKKLWLERRRGGLCRLPVDLITSVWDLFGSRRYLKKRGVVIVVGLGAASMIGPVTAAAAAGIPRIILEQNVLPGRATRLLCRLVGEVITSWPGSEERLPSKVAVEYLGNPVRSEVVGCDRARAAEWFDINPWERTVLVLGGSQGAAALNSAFAGSASVWAKMGLQVIHLAGGTDMDDVEKKYTEAGAAAKVFAFCEKMGFAYAAADLVVSRAGGSALAEIAANGRPAVLVPFPHATDLHQHLNAGAFAEDGGAVVLEEGEDFPSALCDTVKRLIADEETLSRMSAGSAELGRPNAAGEIARKIVGLAECSK